MLCLARVSLLARLSLKRERTNALVNVKMIHFKVKVQRFFTESLAGSETLGLFCFILPPT